MSQIWIAIASIVGAIASWAGTAVMLFSEKKRSEQRKVEMSRDYNNLHESREIFWTACREAYSRFRQKSPINAPNELETLINAAGLPPDLFPRKGRDMTLWPRENVSKLNINQKLLWDFSSLIYQSRQGRSGKVTDNSYIKSEYSVDFHKARGELAHFWN